MTIKLTKEQEMMIRAVKVTEDKPEILDTSAAALVPPLKARITEMNTLHAEQTTGNGGKRGGVTEQRSIAKELRQALRDITQTARVLARKSNPGLADELHFPRQRTYSALLAAGDSFVEVLGTGTLKTQFTGRGFPATFVEDLTALVASFRAAVERKYSGLGEQVSSTAALANAAREGVALVRDLDAILGPKLRKTDVGLYNRWKAAIHVELPPRKKKKKAVAAVTSNQSGGAVIGNQSGAPTVTP